MKYNPFKACVVPRPIGWISTINEDGTVNLAPYSFFNAVTDTPPVIFFGSGHKKDGSNKDSITNIQKTGEFVVNIATYAQKDDMLNSSCSLEYGISEPETFGIEMAPSGLVKPPRVAASPISLECKYISTLNLEVNEMPTGSSAVFGHVVGIYINDKFIVDGKVNLSSMQVICRLGYDEYAIIKDIFHMKKA